ncbi:MAG: zinc metalloprotease [Flavobacteriaceae bacterium]|nr:MAG: zinc metalloprotease [Flavobacteriaceae bacterium]
MKYSLQLVSILALLFVYSCDKDTDETPTPSPKTITIPVVVHVVNYTPDPFVISDEKIKSQIETLNLDYRKKNSDYTKTPDEFSDLVADMDIEFKLATIDPNANPTTGIIRTTGNVTGFDGQDITGSTPVEDLKLYFTNKGGQDAWPSDSYLNIWIADLSDHSGNLSFLGYAQFPGGDSRMDGVVIDPRVFGTLEPLEPGYELGRTATHEIGHWLNLHHVYGLNDTCDSSDFVADTPNQNSQYHGSPVHPQSSCGSNDLFMNFMDRVVDKSMYMFTKGQKQRVHALFEIDGLRRKLYENSKK